MVKQIKQLNLQKAKKLHKLKMKMKKQKTKIMDLYGDNNHLGVKLTHPRQIFYFGMMRKEFFTLG